MATLLVSASISGSCGIAPIGNAPWPVRLNSDVVQVRKEIPRASSDRTRWPKSRSRAKASRAKLAPNESGGSCVVYDLSSQEAPQPCGLEAAGNAPIEPDPSPGLTAEEFPKPGPESPPIEQIGAASPESIWDGEIRIDNQDRTDLLSASGSRPRRYLTAIIIGSVVLSGLGLGLGCLTRSTYLSAAAPPNKSVSSHCAVDAGKETICATRTSDRPDSPAPTGAQDANAISLPTKLATLSSRPTTAPLPAKQATLSPAPTAVDRAKLSARPVAAPETRPATIKGWTVRNVIGGTAVLEGPNGIRNVTRGDKVRGLGKIEDILRWGNRWIVATERGLISTQ